MNTFDTMSMVDLRTKVRRLEDAHRQIQATVDRLKIENEALREIIRQRTFLLDQYMGTPCEQIRREQDAINQQIEPADKDGSAS